VGPHFSPTSLTMNNRKEYMKTTIESALIEIEGKDPDGEFTASAGKDYGSVRSYTLERGDILTVIDHGDGDLYYEIETQEQIRCLPAYLLDAYGYPDNQLGYALILGLNHVDTYEGDGPCRVLRYRSCYAPSPDRADIVSDERGMDMIFDSSSDARDWIETKEAGVTLMGSGQYSVEYVVIE